MPRLLRARVRRAAVLATALVLLGPGAACAGRRTASNEPSGTTTKRGDRNVITQQMMVEQHFKNAFDAVQALHPNWLATRGTDSFASPSQVWVYLDDSKLGGVDQLSGIMASTVGTIRHFNGVDASARWGLDHGAGVIQVLTRLR